MFRMFRTICPHDRTLPMTRCRTIMCRNHCSPTRTRFPLCTPIRLDTTGCQVLSRDHFMVLPMVPRMVNSELEIRSKSKTLTCHRHNNRPKRWSLHRHNRNRLDSGYHHLVYPSVVVPVLLPGSVKLNRGDDMHSNPKSCIFPPETVGRMSSKSARPTQT